MNKRENKAVLYLRKTKKEPYAIGIYENQSVGTRACVFQVYINEIATDNYFISVWELKTPWYDTTEDRFIKLHSISDCRKWLKDNCGGTWVKTKVC